MWSHGASRVSRALLYSVLGLSGPGFLAPFLWQRPSRSSPHPPTPWTGIGSEQERGRVLGANALEEAREGYRAGTLCQRCWNSERSALLLRKSKLLSWQVLHPEGCISCLRKSLGLFLGRGREDPGLQLDDGLLGRSL